MLTIVDEFVVEVFQDEKYVESYKDHSLVQCMTSSFSLFMGILSPTTTK